MSQPFTAVQLPGCGGPSTTPAHNTSFEHALPDGTDRLLQDIQLLIQTGERPPDKRVPILERVKTRPRRLLALPETDALTSAPHVDQPLVGVDRAVVLAQSGYHTGGSRLARQCN